MLEVIPLITRRLDPAGNPGDTFICLGLQWLLSQVVERPSFLLIDKFVPDDFKKYADLIRKAGFLIYAGTPQYNNLDDWCLFYDWAMFKTFIQPMKVKFHTVAGGSGYPGTSMTPQEFSKHCLTNRRTRESLQFKKQLTSLATVRDLHAYRLLTDLGQKVELLPCTALWSPRWLGIEPTQTKVVGLVPPSPRHIVPKLVGCETHEAAVEWFKQYFTKLTKDLKQLGYDTVIICHGVNDYLAYRDMPNVLYSNDCVSLMHMYAPLHGVISTRLHGAIPVAGMNKKALLLGIDTRHSAADVIGIPKLLLGVDNPDQALSRYFNGPDDYNSVMTAAQDTYTKLFKEIGLCG